MICALSLAAAARLSIVSFPLLTSQQSQLTLQPPAAKTMGDNWDDDDDWETAADTVANEDKFAGEDEAPAAAWDAPPAPQVGPHGRTRASFISCFAALGCGDASWLLCWHASSVDTPCSGLASTLVCACRALCSHQATARSPWLLQLWIHCAGCRAWAPASMGSSTRLHTEQ